MSLPVHDLSSGYRIYQANILPGLKLDSRDYDILEEILIKGYAAGWRLREVPCHYQAKGLGRSPGNLLRLARAYLSTMGRMWRLRNSVDCADYDYRAHDSLIPLQRYWQRRRHHLVLNMVDWSGRTLDIGCGSSHILADLGSVIGLDIRLNKLRYGRRFGQPLVQGSIWELPFPDNSFECVLCSEVIEHIAAGDKPFLEMRRVLKPGARLVLGTPDYGHRTWRIIEALYRLAAPGSYADEHITQYSRASLINKVVSFGFRVEQVAYVLHSELILKCTYVGGPPLDGADLAESGSKLAVVTPVIS